MDPKILLFFSPTAIPFPLQKELFSASYSLYTMITMFLKLGTSCVLDWIGYYSSEHYHVALLTPFHHHIYRPQKSSSTSVLSLQEQFKAIEIGFFFFFLNKHTPL